MRTKGMSVYEQVRQALQYIFIEWTGYRRLQNAAGFTP